MKKILDNPIAFLKSHFEQLQLQVEDAFDQTNNNNNNNYSSNDSDNSNRIADINRNRTDMIEKIKSFQTECITNAEIAFKQRAPLFSRQYQLIEKELLNNNNANQEKKDFNRSIHMETVNLKRFLFMNKTLAFIERTKCDEKCILSYLLLDQPKTTAGKLLFIKNVFITTESIEQLHKQ